MKKRLIVCCDGTWQSQNNQVPTNAFKIAQAIKPKISQNLSTISPIIGVDLAFPIDSLDRA